MPCLILTSYIFKILTYDLIHSASAPTSHKHDSFNSAISPWENINDSCIIQTI